MMIEPPEKQVCRHARAVAREALVSRPGAAGYGGTALTAAA
jgi:hypothetical protein